MSAVKFSATLPIVLLLPLAAAAHGIAGKDAEFVAASQGREVLAFLYLGAKHMVAGYDHLLFLCGVIFFLYRLHQVILYVTLFSVGHSLTLLAGVLAGIQPDPYLVDAVIGLSVVYKAFDNLGGFQKLFGRQPDSRVAVLGFGLVHGMGLATRLQDLALSRDGLLVNLVSFNLGVELGQLLALSFVLLAMYWWRRSAAFERQAVAANFLLLTAGFLLIQFQLAGYFLDATV